MFKLNKILPNSSNGAPSITQATSNNNKQTSDNSPVTTVIGADVVITGDISAENNIKIDGHVKGNLIVKNTVILGEKSLISGNVESKNVIVYGNIDGNISCSQLTLKVSGKVNGDISTHTIEIEIGGKYNGRLNMEGPKPQKPTEKIANK
jgi:cytoskeletal protein CcmA (bactofilin family)